MWLLTILYIAFWKSSFSRLLDGAFWKSLQLIFYLWNLKQITAETITGLSRDKRFLVFTLRCTAVVQWKQIQDEGGVLSFGNLNSAFWSIGVRNWSVFWKLQKSRETFCTSMASQPELWRWLCWWDFCMCDHIATIYRGFSTRMVYLDYISL